MKTIKHLFFLLAFSTLAFYSCSDDNPIENPNSTAAQKSIALRTALNEIKNANDLNGRAMDSFCFDFVYPLTFSFNNGTTITVSNYEGLLDVLANEQPTVFVDGIVFPFQVMQGGAIITIDTEGEFNTLLSNCGFVTFGGDLLNTMCFDIVFPMSVISNGQNLEFGTYAEFAAYVNSQQDGQIQIVYPISVMYEGQIVAIANIYEMYEMINNCDQCICTQESAPVCVLMASGMVVEYGNMCYAMCAGYTQNDIVNCNPMSECNIENVIITPGDCNPDYSYSLTINFTYINPGSDQFVVYNSSNAVVGTYNLADLPITIDNYVSTTNATDYLSINIIGGTCNEFYQWILPNCECNCSTDIDPVCIQAATGVVLTFDNMCLAECVGYTANDIVPCGGTYDFGQLLGTCFTVNFPVNVMGGGLVTTVNSNDQLLQYWQPAVGPMPLFVYPITVNFLNVALPVTVQSQIQFESLINANCQ